MDSCADIRVSGCDMRGYKGRSIRGAVGIDMLHRLVALVLVERAVIVVVMGVVLQVQHDVRNAVPVIVRKTGVRHGERLP